MHSDKLIIVHNLVDRLHVDTCMERERERERERDIERKREREREVFN